MSPEGNVRFDRPSPWADNGERRRAVRSGDIPPEAERVGSPKPPLGACLDDLGRAKLSELEDALYSRADSDDMAAIRFETERAMHWLATSNYEVSFGEIPLGERVLSPAGPAESRGMEDARFVRFSEEDGSTTTTPPTRPSTVRGAPQPHRNRRLLHLKISTLPGYAPGARAWPCFPVG